MIKSRNHWKLPSRHLKVFIVFEGYADDLSKILKYDEKSLLENWIKKWKNNKSWILFCMLPHRRIFYGVSLKYKDICLKRTCLTLFFGLYEGSTWQKS